MDKNIEDENDANKKPDENSREKNSKEDQDIESPSTASSVPEVPTGNVRKSKTVRFQIDEPPQTLHESADNTTYMKFRGLFDHVDEEYSSEENVEEIIPEVPQKVLEACPMNARTFEKIIEDHGRPLVDQFVENIVEKVVEDEKVRDNFEEIIEDQFVEKVVEKVVEDQKVRENFEEIIDDMLDENISSIRFKEKLEEISDGKSNNIEKVEEIAENENFAMASPTPDEKSHTDSVTCSTCNILYNTTNTLTLILIVLYVMIL